MARALALNPGNGTANRRLGQIMLSQGAYEQALVHLMMAYEATPWDNATRQLLGEAYLVNGRCRKGLNFGEQLIMPKISLDYGLIGMGILGKNRPKERWKN